MVNKIILIGNLGRDPEFRTLDNGTAVAKTAIATSENYRDKQGEWQSTTEWHDILLWRQLAERARDSLKKGMAIYLEGKLTHRSWEDEAGNRRKTTEVVISYFRILPNQRRESGYWPAEEGRAEGSAEPAVPDPFPAEVHES